MSPRKRLSGLSLVMAFQHDKDMGNSTKMNIWYVCLSILLVVTLACDKKKKEEELLKESGPDDSSQVIIPPESTTTTLPIVTTTTSTTTTSTTTVPVTSTTTTLPVVTTTTTSTTTTTLPVTTTSTTTTSTTTTTTIPGSGYYDVFKDVAEVVGPSVDKEISSSKELMTRRDLSVIGVADRCDTHLLNRDTFADRIAFYAGAHFQPRKARLESIGSLFDMPTDQNKILATSLVSHAMCTVSSETLAQTLGDKKVPQKKTIEKINEFVNEFNRSREKFLAGDLEGQLEMHRQWSRVFMCLAYNESLTTADRPQSDTLAQKYAPSDYRRPAGVLFYEFKNSSSVTSLNLGLFQFTPDSKGNIHPCVRQWNDIYPQCSLSNSATQAEAIRMFGSSLQTLNSFCGTGKATETFSVQVNTSNAKRTHPSNLLPSGQLKAPQDRCVSIHFSAGQAYNHFGSFQNSSGKNLDDLMDCVVD